MRIGGARAGTLLVALLAGLLTTSFVARPAGAQERGGRGEARSEAQGRQREPRGPGWADPADVLAAEIGFARLAQDKGQWTAFRATAARDAQHFDPGPVRVEASLKGRADPPLALKWQPHAVWMACDGSYAVTRGAWQSASASGWFMTVWQRQAKGGYKWVLDQGDALKAPLAAPEFLTAKVADCPARSHPGDDPAHRPAAPRPARDAPPADFTSGHSDDGTLVWATTLGPDGARTGAHHFAVRLRQDGDWREVASADVAG